MIESPEEFVRLRESEDSAEYERAACEEAPLAVWLAVIDQFPHMRDWVAHNKTIPLSVLQQLASDSDHQVRFTVARKRKLSLELQELLARDPEASVRHALACNAKCQIAVLCLLATDSEAFVSAKALRRLEEHHRVL